MPPKSRICLRATSWPGCDGQAGVEHALDRRDARRGSAAIARAFSQCWRMRTRERLDPAQHEPARRTGPGTAPSDFCRKRSRSASAVVVRARRSRRSRRSGRRGTSWSSGRRGRRRARAAAGGTARRRCCRRRAARRRRARPRRRGGCRRRSAAGSTASRPRRVVTSSPRCDGEVLVELLGRDVGEAVALRLVDLRGHPVDAAVDVGDQHDALARVDEVHQRRRRAEPGRERDPVLGALEARERRLERRAGRVRRRASSRSPCVTPTASCT